MKTLFTSALHLTSIEHFDCLLPYGRSWPSCGWFPELDRGTGDREWIGTPMYYSAFIRRRSHWPTTSDPSSFTRGTMHLFGHEFGRVWCHRYSYSLCDLVPKHKYLKQQNREDNYG
ncbi:Protein serine [Echinococcus multilocularis]|uniref:Protein serine n=1 Tax=Echinococcus multilocularis TaxID=6211 RepID=A0A0S4MIA0_ECHMU|nr:Protein serine [Echinococcus multilocularis]